MCTLIARLPLATHITAEANVRNNRTSIARQRLGKDASSTIQALFSVWSVPSCYKRTQSEEATN
jgi:hypothetical protein